MSELTQNTSGDGRVTLTDLHAANIARQAEWCPDQLPDLSFRGNELAGETGEACNVIKKLERERQGWRGSRATKEQLAEELADVVICADLCAVTAGIDLDAAVRDKFNATSEKVGLSTKLYAHPPVAAEPVAGKELAQIRAMLLSDQGDDNGSQILPDFDEGMSVAAMVSRCVHLLEQRRDVLDAYKLKSDETGAHRSRLEAEGWSQASVVSCYWISAKPDHELVPVVNLDLRKLYEATHELAASPPPPAGADGGSAVWTDPAGPEAVAEIKAGMQSIQDFRFPVYAPFNGTYHGTSPVLAGAAGGGSGDLAALSEGASKGEWLLDVQTYYDEDGGPSEDHTEGVMVLDNDDQPDSIVQCSEANAKFLVALVNAYRAGRLIETSAPTPDLGAQGEPVAIPYTLVADEGGTFLQSEAGQLFICADIRTVQRVLAAIGAPPSQPHAAAQAGEGGGR